MMVPYEIAFNKWRERCRFWMHAKRGRCSALAKELSVSRQTVWRWFHNDWARFPGWAAVAANIWYYQQAREADNYLREQQKLSPLIPKPLRQSLPRRTNSRTVAPQFVPRSTDKLRGLAALEFEEA